MKNIITELDLDNPNVVDWLYEWAKNAENTILDFAEWIDIKATRVDAHEWKYGGDRYTKKHTTADMLNIYQSHLRRSKPRKG